MSQTSKDNFSGLTFLTMLEIRDCRCRRSEIVGVDDDFSVELGGDPATVFWGFGTEGDREGAVIRVVGLCGPTNNFSNSRVKQELACVSGASQERTVINHAPSKTHTLLHARSLHSAAECATSLSPLPPPGLPRCPGETLTFTHSNQPSQTDLYTDIHRQKKKKKNKDNKQTKQHHPTPTHTNANALMENHTETTPPTTTTTTTRHPRRHPHRSKPKAPRPPPRPARVPLRQLLKVASVAGGIQFGWALQLSLLTPYVQQLGIPHAWASIIWLCGPLSGLFVQPLVGLLSDRCTSRFGRRRPFILGGAVSIIISVLIIGHAADIGWWFGDTVGHRPWAVAAFVFGFWILDVANNVTQGPCRALLGDLTAKDHRRTRVANAYFSLFMAIGNILGYAAGAYSGWYKVFPFTLTNACNFSCANLKSAFFLDIGFIAVTTYISIMSAHEVPLNSSGATHVGEAAESGSTEEAFMWELFGTFKYFSAPVWIILSVTALTWVGWFPFLLFDTDWMGREIYGGEPNVGSNYDYGVRMGALGLLLNSVVLGITSLLMERLCRGRGPGFVWGIANILMAICFVAMLVVTYIANNMGYLGRDLPPTGIVIAALAIFTILGFPLAITYSVPYALVSTHIQSLGLGQGLSMGVLNLAIVIPQMVVSLGSGPWDQLFGGGNTPAFAVGAVAGLVGGLIAVLAIPRPSGQKPRSQV
ncbi:hypothetical protein RIF29_12065 [Crotalaria pallida]|uniref:Uncharacterized protein n=1 Tax=Crotalaria pallida TaxID=3830 RepID=A0AAN9P0T7_CROPI